MKLYPQVFTVGIANSGTSFITNLVMHVTGLSLGPARGIKRAGMGGHNPQGYWEYLPLRRAVWMASGGNFNVRRIPLAPDTRHKNKGRALTDMARDHGVEVFKCVKLPWLYPWFEPRKAVLIQRAALTVYEKHYRSEMKLNEYRQAHTRYYDLAAKHLDGDWDILWVEYEDFFADTEREIKRVCEYLECPYHKRFLGIFKPREGQ